MAARRQGSAEAGDVLLDMSQALLSFNYRDTFVNAFDVRLPPHVCLLVLAHNGLPLKWSFFKILLHNLYLANPSVLLSDRQAQILTSCLSHHQTPWALLEVVCRLRN